MIIKIKITGAFLILALTSGCGDLLKKNEKKSAEQPTQNESQPPRESGGSARCKIKYLIDWNREPGEEAVFPAFSSVVDDSRSGGNVRLRVAFTSEIDRIRQVNRLSFVSRGLTFNLSCVVESGNRSVLCASPYLQKDLSNGFSGATFNDFRLEVMINNRWRVLDYNLLEDGFAMDCHSLNYLGPKAVYLNPHRSTSVFPSLGFRE